MRLYFITAIIFIAISARAQKLPNIQTINLRAPAKVKVDGRATEWKNQFQAYNKATDVFYTMANDDNKLYLVIQSADEYIIKKMLWGRTILTISNTNKKTDNGITISYPIINRNDRPFINFKDKPKIITGNARSVAEADSFMNANNKRLAEKLKFIKVTGFKDIDDTLISVYNTNGIKAMSGFNNKMAYTYELAIDLKLLGMDVNTTEKFYYNLTLSELPIDDRPGINIVRKDNGEIQSISIDKNQANPATDIFAHTTDFWGEYILAK